MFFRCLVYSYAVKRSFWIACIAWTDCILSHCFTSCNRKFMILWRFVQTIQKLWCFVVHYVTYCRKVSKQVIFTYTLVTRFKGYLRHFMILWYIYTLTHIKRLKRANKHVTRAYKHTDMILYTCDRSTGQQVDRWTGGQVTHWHTLTGGQVKKTQRKEDTTHTSVSCPLWHKQNTIWLNP